jgi:hypothetical protein
MTLVPNRRDVTDQTTAPSTDGDAAPQKPRHFPLGRTLVWLGIAGASAALTFVLLRASMQHPEPSDETTERIQALIDEANRLIKTLDEKKQS